METRLIGLTLLVFCLFPLAAQHSFHLSGGFAESISKSSATGPAVQLGYDRTFSMKGNLDFVVGLGLKQMEYTKTTKDYILGRVISEPPVPNRGEDTYLIRQSNLQLRLGVQRRFGRISLGGYLLPSYRINSRLDYDFTYYSINDIAVGTFNLVVEFTNT